MSNCKYNFINNKNLNFIFFYYNNETNFWHDGKNEYSTLNTLQRYLQKDVMNGWRLALKFQEKLILGQWNAMCQSPKKLIIENDMTAKVYKDNIYI